MSISRGSDKCYISKVEYDRGLFKKDIALYLVTCEDIQLKLFSGESQIVDQFI